MHPSSRFCLLVAFWSVFEFYKLIFPILLGFVLMDCAWSLKILTQMGDFGCGFVVFGCSSSLGNIILLLFVAFGLGLRVLQCGGLRRCICQFMGKSRVLRDGFSSKRVCNDGFDWTNKDFACGVSKESRSSSKANGDHCLEERNDVVGLDGFHGAKEEVEEEEKVEGEEVCSEDEVLSVTALRETVKSERRRANAALRDLEKERMAAASAAEEAMAMILRLQSEKSSLQIQANQMQRLADEKHAYDQEVIQSLQWNVMQYEEERSLLEQQLKFCKKRLNMYMQDNESELLDCIASPCTPRLSHSRLAGCNLEDLRIGSLD